MGHVLASAWPVCASSRYPMSRGLELPARATAGNGVGQEETGHGWAMNLCDTQTGVKCNCFRVIQCLFSGKKREW